MVNENRILTETHFPEWEEDRQWMPLLSYVMDSQTRLISWIILS